MDDPPKADLKADLKAGDLLEPGYSSNYGERRTANYVNLSSAQIRRLNRPEATDSWFALVAAVAALASAFVVRP